ncbi:MULTISPECIES: M57 family metalloprotease [unclassified Exiguobacterium]|uniref:M57 family metalloprotease n=1 Tax=unclassified Exiguobacterium TaxID=2644629 RepID=UPI001BEBB50C|nr:MULTISPECIES: M57 family metalloprotease [unclassified Exiguobacterium]
MKKVLILGILFSALFFTVQHVDAYALLGGKHSTASLNYAIKQFDGTYTKVGAPLNSAVADWNATATKVSFNANQTSYKITVTAKNFGNVSWSGYCSNSKDFSGNYTSSAISGNLYYLNQASYTASKVKGVWAHEFGHALGLAHVSQTNKLMYNNDGRTVYKPTTDEINGVNSLYK